MDARRAQGLLRTYFLLAFAITWAVWVPRAMVSRGWFESDLVAAIGPVWSYGPAMAAILAAGMVGGRAALRDLGSRLIRWRVGWTWYAVALGLPVLLAPARPPWPP